MRLEPARRFVGLVRPAHGGALLRLGPQPLSLAFSAPSRGVWATGIGVTAEGGAWLPASRLEWVEAPLAAPPGPYFGGWGFDSERGWAGFQDERWVLPEVLAWWDGARAWVAAFGEAGTSPSALADRLAQVEEVEPVSDAAGVERRQSSGRAEFRQLVDDAVTAIRAGQFSKVVVARAIEFAGAHRLNERALLKSLEVRNQQSFTFLVRGSDGSAFIGSSPELLCEVKDGVLSADALAGTSSVDGVEALLRSDKDLREHQAVVDGIRASLTPYVTELQHAATPSLRTLPNVVHLHTSIRGTMRPGAAPLEVARALSPTAAVCGAPRVPAREWLRAHEGFARGWYAGAVGFTGPNGTMLSVAIRSALVRGNQATVFVGAGIVEGSTAEGEWVETERKARTLLSALGVDHG